MQEPRLRLFDLGHLVSELNSSLLDKSREIRLGGFQSENFKKNPLYYKLHGLKLGNSGNFPLTQIMYGGVLGGDFGKVNPGYIYVETGEDNRISNFEGIYEILQLRIKHPLELEGEKSIPNCCINFLRTKGLMRDLNKREDYVRNLGVFWKGTDLKDVLPSEWFLKGEKVA